MEINTDWMHKRCGADVAIDRSPDPRGLPRVQHRCANACPTGGRNWQVGEPGDGVNYIRR